MSLVARVQRRLTGAVGEDNEANRRRWVENELQRLPAGTSILDAGAGECQYKPFCAHLEYTSQDFAEYTGDGDQGLQMGTWDTTQVDIVSDITAIPVGEGSFDAVLCTEVLEHVPDPLAALRELARVLKSGGVLILTAPFNSLTHFAPYHYATGFNRFFYEKVLPDLGFTDLQVSVNGNYFAVQAQELRRLRSVAQQYGGRSMGRLHEIGVAILLRDLSKLDRDGHEAEVLNAYGLHVVARKT